MDSKPHTIKELRAKPELITPNWLEYIENINKDVSKEWEEGPSGKIDGIKNSTFKSYVKKLESGMEVRTEAEIEGINIDKFAKTLSELRSEWDERMKDTKLILDLAEGKVVYVVLKTPFPLSDRDAMLKSYRICNKTNSNLVKKYRLPNVDHKYYLILDESVEIEEYPKVKGKERAQLNSFFMIEEVTGKKNCIKVRASMRNDLGGSIPDFMMDTMAKKMPKKSLSDIVECIPRLEKEGFFES